MVTIIALSNVRIFGLNILGIKAIIVFKKENINFNEGYFWTPTFSCDSSNMSF